MRKKVAKEFTYYSLIKEAISSYKERKATSSQIFNYVRAKHPTIFKNSNSMTWMGNIRQLLSKHPEFQKLEKENGSKLHFWVHKPIELIEEEENRLNKYLLEMPRYSPNHRDIYYNYDQYGYYWFDNWNSPQTLQNQPIKKKDDKEDKKENKK